MLRSIVILLKDDSPLRVGEVLVSLCYLPTSGRLTFVVLKARLSKKEIGDILPSKYCTLSHTISRIKARNGNAMYDIAFD